MQAYDDDNIFAKILRGVMPCHRVFEDEAALAFMDVMPRVPGHVLVIPKARARNLLDIEPAALAALMPRVQRVGVAVQRALQAPGLLLQQFNEEAAGQQVFHLHFHLLPRFPDVVLGPPASTLEKPEVLAGYATRIKTALDEKRPA